MNQTLLAMCTSFLPRASAAFAKSRLLEKILARPIARGCQTSCHIFIATIRPMGGYDVLVLGAGIAALAAARAGAGPARRAAVVEARERMGGLFSPPRVRTKTPGKPFAFE